MSVLLSERRPQPRGRNPFAHVACRLELPRFLEHGIPGFAGRKLLGFLARLFGEKLPLLFGWRIGECTRHVPHSMASQNLSGSRLPDTDINAGSEKCSVPL